MHADHYCCFAIPLYNVGIYVILAQFTVFGLVSGILVFSTPSILAIAVPQTLTAIFGVLCIIIGLAQAIGFYGVYKERVAFFRKYIIFNAILVFITLFYSLILIVLSATHHQRAIQQCILQFVSNDDNLATVSASGRTICNIWTWAQLGVCGLLWVLFCASEIYFMMLERRWGKDQKIDHLKYRSIVSAARESMAISVFDEGSTPRRSHVRGTSSVSTVGSNRLLNTQPAKSSRLRNEIEWKELNTELEPIKKDQAEEVGTWVEGGAGLSDAEFYRAATPRTRVGTATSHSSASSMATKSILKPTIR
ncbi:hypothetical protein CROQUDRAFT_663573 [Cronartium quercuum f. sp. fusiforme G11]|uniref:Uncharacterized protein n=1 Tax=Cronartium quercuum f. sp. fusiforme G11 TaxID=708437 RepID=A0A9P6NCQ4_9BASI|nr:hypothetical protein CROQUDRAFT_663573 [Cronartium quercuum f. sp. fusiforme G11]